MNIEIVDIYTLDTMVTYNIAIEQHFFNTNDRMNASCTCISVLETTPSKFFHKDLIKKQGQLNVNVSHS